MQVTNAQVVSIQVLPSGEALVTVREDLDFAWKNYHTRMTVEEANTWALGGIYTGEVDPMTTSTEVYIKEAV